MAEYRSVLLDPKEADMTKALPVVAVAAMFALAAAVPTQVQARDEGAIIGGAIGGLALGAILGGAAARARPRYYEPRAV